MSGNLNIIMDLVEVCSDIIRFRIGGLATLAICSDWIGYTFGRAVEL